jgi:hypothetical protein
MKIRVALTEIAKHVGGRNLDIMCREDRLSDGTASESPLSRKGEYLEASRRFKVFAGHAREVTISVGTS